MAKTRRAEEVWKSKPTVEGAGVHLRRAFGFHEVPQLDPFLLLDDFRSNEPAEYQRGFPRHPHRGMETIIYVREAPAAVALLSHPFTSERARGTVLLARPPGGRPGVALYV